MNENEKVEPTLDKVGQINDLNVHETTKCEIFSWMMFDFANSSYITVIITAIYAPIFSKYIVGNADGSGDLWWGISTTLANVIALILSPYVGAVCDYRPEKHKYLTVSTFFCCFFCCLLYFAEPGNAFWAVLCIALSYAGFLLSEVFNSSFLPDLANENNLSIISGLGWGFGYMGGLLALLVNLFIVSADEQTQLSDYIWQQRISCVAIGVFFMLSSLPTLLVVRSHQPAKPGFENASIGTLLRAGFQDLKKAGTLVRENRCLFRFFVAFLFYMGGVDVVVKFVGIFADDILTSGEIVIFFLILQFSAAGGALLFGWLEQKFGSKRIVLSTIILWTVAILSIAFIDNLSQFLAVDKKILFYIISLFAGMGIGSIQSSSRTIVGLMAPKEHVTQIFGFWGLFFRLSSFWTFLFSVITKIFSRQAALIYAAGLFVCGFFILLSTPIIIQSSASENNDLKQLVTVAVGPASENENDRPTPDPLTDQQD
eukprot:TRINITY_DN347_c0_g1_i1.p1 TRINITY_DN347_c0_g1~~TRINITY_DN347_c0_g1_i1.p1  ORF type:complete len:493 (-),score=120.59 TRINITY_DN347_c0_g1_i1:83-1537(-)